MRESIIEAEIRGYEKFVTAVQNTKKYQEFCLEGFFDKDVNLASKRFQKSRAWLRSYELLKPKGNELILDFGAGRGISSSAFIEKGLKTVTLEMNRSKICGLGAISKYKSKNKFNPILGDAERLPFNDNSFDIVYCNHVLHHATSLEFMVKEAVRVLKPNGKFIAQSEVMKPPMMSDEGWKKNFLPAQMGANEQLFTTFRYKGALSKAGLKKVHAESLVRIEDFKNTSKGKIAKALFGTKITWKLFSKFYTYFGLPGNPILLYGIKK